MSGFASSNFIKPSSSFGEREASSTGEQSGSVVVPRLPLNAALPVHEHRDRILYALEKYPVLIMVGETGCGKSTQIPQMLYRAGWTEKEQCIVCTQPRRLAALSLSKRVSEEMCTNLGEKVGYSVRFDDNFNKRGVRTAIKYATEATLIRETLHDPLLSGYSVVMVDEAHERSLQGDVLLGLLKKILRHRKSDFRVIVASATLDTAALRDFFEPVVGSSNKKFQQVCVLQVGGAATGDDSGGRRMHPVDLAYLKRPCANFILETVDTVLSLHSREQQQGEGGAGRGDILCFLPGHEDVELAARMLTERLDADSSSSSDTARNIVVVPLHEHLPTSVQMRVFQPTASAAVRKVILATSIAETAITVPGVRYVVDSGYTQYRYFDVRSGVETLTTCLASKAVAVQRSGRAGRTMPGRCFRLMTEEFYRTSPDIPLLPTAEMQRVDVTWAVLQLKAIGIDDILHFDFLSPPSPASLIHALELLYSLGALDRECRLTTATGARMAELPLNPKLSKCLLASLEEGCAVEMLAIAAMSSVPFPFLSPAQLNGIRHSYQQRGSDGSSRSQQQQHDAQPTKAELRRYLQTCITAFVYPHSSHRAKEGHGHGHEQSDHLTLLAVYNAFAENGCNRQWCERHCLQFEVMQQAHAVRTNLYRLVRQYEIASDGAYVIASCSNNSDSRDTLLKCLVAGLFANAAKLGTDGRYHTLKGGVPCRLHPTSCLLLPPPGGKRGGASGPPLQHLPDWIVYSEVSSTTLPGSSSSSSSSSYGGYDFQHEREVAVLREASRIHPRWLADLASHYYKLYENEQQP